MQCEGRDREVANVSIEVTAPQLMAELISQPDWQSRAINACHQQAITAPGGNN